MARGAGLPNGEWVRDEAHFDKLPFRRLEDGGPVLLGVKIEDKPGPIRATRWRFASAS